MDPCLSLWPWVLALLIFAAYLTYSGQAHSQLADLKEHPSQMGWTLVGLVCSQLLVLAACLFTSLVVNIDAVPDRETDATSADGRSTGRLFIVWSMVIALAPGLLLACVLQSWWISLTTCFMAVVCGFGIRWLLRGAWLHSQLWAARMKRLHARRYVLAALVLAMAVLPLMLGAWVFTRQPDLPRIVGATFVELLGLAAVSTLFGAMLVAIPRCLRWPWMGTVATLSLVVWNLSSQSLVDQENPLLVEQRAAARRHVEAAKEVKKCHHARRNSVIPRERANVDTSRNATDVHLVSAEGGGMRAAYWSAAGLAMMDLATDSDFGNRVRLMSGVSGGSVGIATWLAARETAGLDARQRLDLVTTFLSSDFLAPAVAGLLFLDAPRLVFGTLWPNVRRDDLFEAALVTRWGNLSDSDFLLRPLFDLCFLELTHPPTIYFNSTEVVGGSPASVGNTQTSLPGGSRRYLNEALPHSSLVNLTVAQAAVMSARFPLLSPAAEIGISRSVLKGYMERTTNVLQVERARAAIAAQKVPELIDTASRPDLAASAARAICGKEVECQRMGVLVDGGYFDNSGLYPIRQALNRIVEANSTATIPTRARIGVVHFSNSQAGLCTHNRDWRAGLSTGLAALVKETKFEPACDYELEELEATQAKRTLQWLTSPLQTILSVRDGHTNAEKQDIRGLVSRPLKESMFVDISLKDTLSHAYCLELETQGERLACQRRLAPETRIMGTQLMDGPIDARLAAAALSDRLGTEIRKCAMPYAKEYPPLGWMLRRKDAQQLRCLSASAAFNALSSRSTAQTMR